MNLETTYKIKDCAADTVFGNMLSNISYKVADNDEKAEELYKDLLARVDDYATRAFHLGLEQGRKESGK